MGNPDIVVIINGEIAYLVKGTEYSGVWYDEAISLAIKRHREHIYDLQKGADNPEELDEPITKIEVVELC